MLWWNPIRPRKMNNSSRNFVRVLVDPSRPTVDIVAVHGLNPLDKQAHAEATWTTESKLWLRDFLPTQAPDARILLFGYNSNVVFQTAASGVREQAENLLSQLDELRRGDPHRPLIFICHSLGGIIVKRALVLAKTDNTYEALGRSTFGVAFFGTPHRGGKHAGIGDIIAKVVRAILGNPGNTFMGALKEDSPFLKIITDDFRQLLENFQILSFYETRPLTRLGVVVDHDSAVLGLPGTREKQIGLDADHRNICKFASDEDPGYQQVANNIVQMINAAIIDHKHQASASASLEENMSNSEGEYNTTLQAGQGNESRTNGISNKIRQLGNGNKSKTSGNGNTTTQISAGAMDSMCYVQTFKQLISDGVF
ncbi:uncharacterized protein F4822DRAFT_224746 [Hypoxylon trugodes]|uniref:uncharacterized protein n=1 Tax=Hypoxylon trugodes TaxID=326681 RepID=UPI00219AB9B6|nr:uncharacterized protein F4822DRAFT_224746 [Hypoxylon trugodes]KAI1390113.1 hypothetical protein F4822DRAFT_224746 [Hypoxylon trugodes]